MKNKIMKGILILALGFLALFFLRLLYGYLYVNVSQNTYDNIYQQESSLESYSRKNIATKKYKQSGSRTGMVEQKYEKIADIQTHSAKFEDDENEIMTVISTNLALVQYEKRSGLKRYRTLQLSIGVPPENFDKTVDDLSKVGNLKSIVINKTDKTNDYNKLTAKKKSLEKTKSSLVKLKTHGGNIDELIKLENRILEIEEELQGYGVELGEYDEENEFCTVKIEMYEKASAAPVSVAHRLKVAFEWTVKYYAGLIFILTIGSFFVLIVLLVLEKLKWVPDIFYKLFEAESVPDEKTVKKAATKKKG